jgi:hypothetical protein
MAVRREAFQRVGGFDTRLETCEDVDLCRRLRAAGCTIVEDSRLRNVHLGDPATLREVFYGELWRGRDNLRASLRPPIALRDLLSAAIPVAHLALLLAAIAGTIAGTRRGFTIAIGALAAVVLLVSLRAIRMVVQSDRHTMRTWAQALSVALTYDLARALAIVHGATHAARTGHG